MVDVILTINAGSSSIKFAAYQFSAGHIIPLALGHIDGIGGKLSFAAGPARGHALAEVLDLPDGVVDHRRALGLAVDWLQRTEAACRIIAVGHRVVHGGASYGAPQLIDDNMMSELRHLIPLAPLHQPHNIAGVEAALHAFPEAAQVACFDTAFHRSHPFVADTFALPRRFYDEGVRRYGFHGLSYEYVSRRLQLLAPRLARGRVLIAHLGNGASICALRDGRSVASTMGFTALDGLPMGTRCGQLDPGVVLYLLTEKGMSPEAITDLLYKESGLKGISAVSNDMRELEASSDPAAKDAVNYFVARVRREIGGLAATIGGVDAIVFTGGIGEHAVRIRESILGDMGWLGVHLDSRANGRNAQVISMADSQTAVFVIPTDEDRMIAEHTAEVAGLIRTPSPGTPASRLSA